MRYGDGWMPHTAEAADVAVPFAELQRMMAAAGRPPAQLAVLTTLPFDDFDRAVTRAREFAGIGTTHLIHGWRYAGAAAFEETAVAMTRLRGALEAK